MIKHIITLFLLGATSIAFCQKSKRKIATLKDSINSWDLLVNNLPYHTIKSGDYFYYYPKKQTACSINRKSGYIPQNKIKIIDSLNYLKFEFIPRALEFKAHHEDLICAKRNNIDYISLVKKAINKDGNALKEILKLEPIIDGAAKEYFPDRFWKIIHFWSDEELSKLLMDDTTSFKDNFTKFIKNEFYTGFTPTEIKEYLILFYPKTLKSINFSKN